MTETATGTKCAAHVPVAVAQETSHLIKAIDCNRDNLCCSHSSKMTKHFLGFSPKITVSTHDHQFELVQTEVMAAVYSEIAEKMINPPALTIRD